MHAPLATAVAALAALAGPAFGVCCAASAQADDRVIAPRVSAGGVDIGGLTVDAAAAKLNATLTPPLSADIVVEVQAPAAGGGGSARTPAAFRLTATQAKFSFDPLLTAKRAAHVLAEPQSPTAGGAAASASVPLAVRHSRRAVAAWVKRIASQSRKAPRDATLKLGIRHQSVRRAVVGYEVNRTATEDAVDAALDQGVGQRTLRATLRTVRPKVNADDLRGITIVTIDRSTFTLRLFKNLKLRKRYGIAVGMAGLDTPAGSYRIQNRQVDPAWHVPRSAWAGSLQGKVIPGGIASNPLKARWLGIANGVGIHGTSEEWSIGSRASHGCIRMRVADVIDLYPRVPVGASVLVK